jgi:hypothetical protein
MGKCLADFPFLNGALMCPANGMHIMQVRWVDDCYVGVCFHCQMWVAPVAPNDVVEEAEAAGAIQVHRPD